MNRPENRLDARPDTAPRVGLFVTCLVDLMRPSVGFAA
ncbi:MAG TPA: (Fe-S)-binding protein, partial [Enterovirga sp.]